MGPMSDQRLGNRAGEQQSICTFRMPRGSVDCRWSSSNVSSSARPRRQTLVGPAGCGHSTAGVTGENARIPFSILLGCVSVRLGVQKNGASSVYDLKPIRISRSHNNCRHLHVPWSRAPRGRGHLISTGTVRRFSAPNLVYCVSLLPIPTVLVGWFP